MALINCPECGKADVSSTATQCPKCGYNIREHFELIEKQRQEQLAEEKKQAEIDKKIKDVNDRRNAEIEEIREAPLPVQPQFFSNLFDFGEMGCVTTFVCGISLLFFIGAIGCFATDKSGVGLFLMLLALGLFIWYMACEIADYKEETTEYENIVKDFNAYKEEQIKPINEKYDEKIKNLKTYGEEYNPYEIKRAPQSQQAQPKCPTCGSTNVSKISTLNRSASVYAVGLASNKIGKQFKCGKCGYMW